MKGTSFLLLAAGARLALAQPVVRDHRGAPAPPPPVVRDHRDAATTPAPIVRDHRDAATAPAPIVRDHRTPVEEPPPAVKPLPITPAKVTTAPRHDHAHDHQLARWSLDQPVVSSYWPMKGTAGTKVRIRGRNFAAGTAVLWGATPVPGARVDRDEIVFVVPRDAAPGRVVLRAGEREVVVGAFDVAPFDATAAWRDAEQARRSRAEVVQIAKATDDSALDADRPDRRAREADAIRAAFPPELLARPDAQAELTLHAQRVAELARMARLAGGDRKLAVRIELARLHEQDRHDARMAALAEVP